MEKVGTLKVLKKLLTFYNQTAEIIRPPKSSFAYFLGVSKVSSLSFRYGFLWENKENGTKQGVDWGLGGMQWKALMAILEETPV